MFGWSDRPWRTSSTCGRYCVSETHMEQHALFTTKFPSIPAIPGRWPPRQSRKLVSAANNKKKTVSINRRWRHVPAAKVTKLFTWSTLHWPRPLADNSAAHVQVIRAGNSIELFKTVPLHWMSHRRGHRRGRRRPIRSRWRSTHSSILVSYLELKI